MSHRADLSALVNLHDFHDYTRKFLPKSVYDWFASGAFDEQTLAENETAYKHWLIRPRFLVDVSNVKPHSVA